MGDRFNIQAGDWDTDANWAAASGGAGGASYPIAGDDAILDDNSGNCTLDANAACDSLIIGQVGALYTGTLDAGSSDVAIGSGGLDCSYGGSATLDLGSGTWTITDGDLDYADLGTLDDGTSTVQLAGTGDIHGKNANLYKVTIAAGAAITLVSGSYKVANTQTINGTLTLNSGTDPRLLCSQGATCHVNTGGELVVDGTYYIQSS